MRAHDWYDADGLLLGGAWPLPLNDPFTARQAEDAGVSPPRLRRLTARGLLRQPLHGVYVAAQAPDSVRSRCRALRLVLSPEAVVTDRAAAWLHGMPVLRRGAHLGAPPIEVCHRTDTRTRRAQLDGHRRTLAEYDVAEVHGVLVTTPLRTALDLGRLLWRFDALASLDAALRAGVEHDRLLSEIDRFAGYRGVVQLRTLAPLADARAESPGESALRLRWYDALLPRPDLQIWVADGDGVPVYRLDLGLERLRLAAEYDGEAHHSSAADRMHDVRRREWLATEVGWTVLVFTRQQVYGEGRLIERTLREALGRSRGSLARWSP